MGALDASINAAVIDFDPYNTRTEEDSTMQFGALYATVHGRDAYRYGKVGASTVSKAHLALAPAAIANHQNQLIDATTNVAANTAIGSKRLYVDNGGTAAPVGIYDQGWLVIVDGTGEGQTLGVQHSAVAGTSADILLDLDDPLAVAVVAGTTEYALVHNPYNAFIEAAVKTRTAAGVAVRDLLTGDYGWLKTKGIVGALGGSAVTLGGRLTSDGTTPGAVTDNTDVTTVQTEVEIGQASIIAGATGEHFPIVLSID